MQQVGHLFDDLFSGSNHRCWKVGPKRLGCLEVDAQYITVGLFHRQITGARAFQDFIDQACALACQNSQVRTKTYQSTFSNSLSKTMAVVAGMSQSANNGPKRCRSGPGPGAPILDLGSAVPAK